MLNAHSKEESAVDPKTAKSLILCEIATKMKIRPSQNTSLTLIGLLLFFTGTARSQTTVQPRSETSTDHEKKAARAFEAVRANPLELNEFLAEMPKGADLHNHLSGAVYAESWIRAAAADHLCVNPDKLAFAPQPANRSDGLSQQECSAGDVPAAAAFKDQHLYDALVDSFSMRGFVPSPGITGHDHFFSAFDKFHGVSSIHLGEWLDEVATRAAAQNEQYLELMQTPEFAHTADLVKEVGWRDDFAQLRTELLARGLGDDIARAKTSLDEAESLQRQREHCGQPDSSAACHVQVRYLCQILRGFPKERVFAQSLQCFEIASKDPRFVGINMVMPEDGYVSMADYALHMRIIGFLHGLYPKVHISLHAGELAPGLVPYEGLCCHIRLAVERAQAERIGHGVDIMNEERPYDLLKEMAAKHVMVEINLTSNDLILGVRGGEHPFAIYRKFHVPVALSTDDEGVSRINLTHEFARAVATYDLHYADLKMLTRTSLEHSFLPGASLWSQRDEFTRVQSACSQDSPGSDVPSPRCATFLKASEKAGQQWELERRFRIFEVKF